jgi:hypothetical protein
MNTPRCGHNLSGALSKAVEERQAREDAEKSDAIDERSRQLSRSKAIREPGLQVIITTTSPPPEPLREPPTCVLKLSRASEDLLLKRRIENLLSRATSNASDASDASDEEKP